MKKILFLWFILFILLSPNETGAATTYAILDLGNIDEKETTATSINDNGIVVGSIGFQEGAFKWQNGQTTILPFLDVISEAGAASINNNNEIVGYSPLTSWHHAVMWDDENNIKDLGGAGFAEDINEDSQVVIRGWQSWESILWDDNSVTVIASYELNGIEESGPNAINDNGQVVGWGYIPDEEEGYEFAYLWEDDTFSDLNDLITDGHSETLTSAVDINNSGQILGGSWLFEDGGVLELGFSGASAINELGQIVGNNYLYDNGTLYDLTEFIETDISYTNLKANDINNLGQIVGNFSVNGETHAFLMNPLPFTVTFSSAGNGSITGETSQAVQNGENCTEVAAVADDEYHFVGWSGDYEGSDNPLTITNVTADMNITANFAINTYSVSFTAADNGSITGETDQVVASGEDCSEVTAVPDTGYHFDRWSGDLDSTENPLTIHNITADMSIAAHFEVNTYLVAFFSAEHGGLSGDVEQVVAYGASCTQVTAYPETGYQFTGWSGGYEGSDNPLTITNVTSDMNITANYVLAYDGNNDGVPDALQDHVKNLKSANNQNVTLEFAESVSATTYGSTNNPSPEDTPEDIDFPYGFFYFTIEDVGVGETTAVSIYLPDDAAPDTYYKYGRTLSNPTPHWYEFLYDGSTGAEINGNIITLHLIDGNSGDDDLAANGAIVDVGGPGVLSPILPDDTDDDGDGFSENQGDCDDGNIAIFPGAIEICGDGIDQDCDGTDSPCTGDDDDITPDSSPDNVESVLLDSGFSIAFQSSTGTTISNCLGIDNPSTADTPADIDFPLGFFSFVIEDVGAGGSTTMTITLPGDTSPTTYYKYGPTPDDPSNHWYEFLYDGETGAIINNNEITLHFIDGKRGDSDLDDTNGTIVDPGGPGVIADSDTPDTASNEGGGGGGCFITTLLKIIL